VEKKPAGLRSLQIGNYAGWYGGLILVLLTLSIWFLGQRRTESKSSSWQGKRPASQDKAFLSGDGSDAPSKWRSRARDAPKRPNLKPLTPEQREQGIAEDAAFRKQAYAAYEGALQRDAATNPELRAVMDLRAETGKDTEKLSETRARIRSWESASPGMRSILNDIRPTTDILAIVRQMEDRRVHAILGPPSDEVKKRIAGSLVDMGISPSAMLTENSGNASLISLRGQLLQEIDKISDRPGLPTDLFNRETGLLLMSEELHRILSTRARELASPATKELADQADSEVAIQTKQLEERTKE
jgi:hypothetical protein